MVFSSLPIYLDPPNWQQHLNQQQTNGNHESPELILQPQQANGNHENPEMIQPQQANGNHENSQLIIQPQQDQQSHQPPPNHMAPNFTSSGSRDGTGGGHVGGSNSTANTLFRHNSLAERGRVVKNIAAQPEGAPLKCPRCESINTKFCYFNNYNLSQPRHFCKTCRRYWTRGGALRNVPVGGGCRRNKRSKSNQSKSNPSTGIIGPTAIGIGIGIGINNTTICRFTSTSMTTSEGIMLTSMGTGSGSLSSTAGRHHSTTTPHLSLMATSLQNMSTQLGMGNLGHSFPAGTLQPQGHHQLATKMTVTSSPDHNLQDHQFGTSGPLYLSMQLQQTNHQFPFMAAAGYHHEAVPSAPAVSVLYPFQNDHEGCDASIYASSRGWNHDDQLNMVRSNYKGTTTSGALLTDQNAPVKMENYSFQKKLYLGMSAGTGTSQFSWINSSGSGDNDLGSY